MKNLLIYINPDRKFDEETQILVKIQIDNSLDLGWKREDIMLVTNFDYEYDGVKALVINDSAYCSIRPHSTKTTTIHYLFEHELIESGILYWVHDFDNFQSVPISKIEAKILIGFLDMGLSDYGRLPKWSTGSIFFRIGARDIFKLMTETIYKKHIDEEKALSKLTNENINDITSRVKKINISYNFQVNDLQLYYPEALKPLRVLHFHPFKNNLGKNPLDFFLHGNNEISTVLASKRLINIFKKYDIA